MAARFHRVESVVFLDPGATTNSIGIRLAVTRADGLEQQQVVHFSPDEEHQVHAIQTQVEALLSKDKRLGFAAVSRAILASMGKKETANNE